jgi:ABC-type oligopeptide transport system substrate-binding subunit/tRNA A-37 threonylcarbamoyl transferase component Bud32
MIGTVLQDRYTLQSEIGSGGMGTIYRAHDRVLDRDVALKLLTNPTLGEEGRAKLHREAQAAAKLNHPNIVSVYDAGIHEENTFIVMELVEGASVHLKPPEGVEALINVTEQIASALEHAHNQNIVHRDLKPENVLIATDGTVKLMDFGLARSIASRMTSEGSIEGTVFFMAPEQALGQATDHRTDFYSLGVMLYELATGQLPFTSDDPLQVISQHIYAPVVPPSFHNPNIPCDLEELILHLLSKRPGDRPQNANQILESLKAIDIEKVEAGPEATISPIERIVRGRIVGRDSEMQEAAWIWRKAAGGEGQVLLISGEPGIGKTRFTQEIRTLAEVEGGVSLVGECYAEGSAPCSAISQIVRQALNSEDIKRIELPESYISSLLKISPELQFSYPGISSTSAMDPEVDQEHLFETVLTLCTTLSSKKPLLLTIEDAHWADSCTLQFLRHIARRTKSAGLKILIVLTYREVELDENRALNDMLYDLNREHLSTRIKLLRLSREGTRDLLNLMFQEEVSQELSERIYLETEGNPFFIEEVCKALIEDGKLYLHEGRWRRRETEELEVPQSVRIAIQSRIGKLSSETQEALRLAAIFGREFEFEILRAVCDHDEDTLIDSLEQAEQAQIITELPQRTNGRNTTDTTFAFVHALIPSTLRESVSGLRRQRLHLRAAIALERIYPNRLNELAPRIGQHFAEAGNGQKASEYLLKAGDNARKLYAYQEAIDAYEQALVFLREQREYSEAGRILMQLGLLYVSIFDFNRSRRAYQEGFTLWQRASESALDTPLSPAPHPFRQAFGAISTLDPTLIQDEQSATVADQIFCGLVELRGALDVAPHLAHTWEVLEDGRKYLFHLRDDFRWTDGVPVTAHDIEFAWKRVLDPEVNSPAASWLYDVRGAKDFHQGQSSNADSLGVKAIDDFTLSVELEAPTSYFLHIIGFSITYPIPKHVFEIHGEEWTKLENLVSNGPFQISSWEPEEGIMLSRNHQYQGTFDGNLEQIELNYTVDWQEQLDLYNRAKLDIFGGMPPSELGRLRPRYANEYITAPNPATTYIGLNITEPPFNDQRIRQALAHAINREKLANIALQGFNDPATGGFVPPGVPGHVPNIAPPFNPDLARQLMTDAGFVGGENLPLVKIFTTQFPYYRTIAGALEADLTENLGMQIEIVEMGFAEILERIRTENPHIFTMGWNATYPDPDDFLRVAARTNIPSGWDPRYDALVDEARRVSDHAKRMEMYAQAERILADQVVLLPLLYARVHIFVKPWVKKLPLQPIRVFSFKDIIIEEH